MRRPIVNKVVIEALGNVRAAAQIELDNGESPDDEYAAKLVRGIKFIDDQRAWFESGAKNSALRQEITIALTVAEANAASHMFGNCACAPDCMEALFRDGRKRNAAWRAIEKLNAALYGNPKYVESRKEGG
jgi:hypothetical protein